MPSATCLAQRSICLLALFLACSDTGCGTNDSEVLLRPASPAISGSVHGGQQPISGATIELLAVGQTGDGSAATSLMTSAVTTNASGNFSLTGDYACPAPTPTFPGEVYLVAIGGNPGLGAGKSNPQVVLMAGLGLCSELTSSTFVSINEITTVGTIAALAPYMSSYAAIGSGSADAESLNGAMTMVNAYVNTATGLTPGPALPSGYTAPSTALTTLADAISACVNSSGGVAGDKSNCGTLFGAAMSGATAPTDTVGSVLNILNNPTNNVATIFGLVPTDSPFQPMLASAPSTWALPLLAPGNGTLTMAASSYAVNENGGSVTLSVTRTEGDTGAVSVSYATANGTATAGTDYTATSGTLSWGNGDSSAKTLTVPVLDAGVSGGSRNFTVSLGTAAGGASLGTTTSATVTIYDTDVLTSYFVSPTGNDTTGTGSQAAPFATLARAQTAMRGGSVKVTQIEAGTYYLTTPLALTSADNGETWEAAQGASPVISGGVPVTGWTNAGNGIWTAPYSTSPGIDFEINGTRQYPAVLNFDPLRPYISGWNVLNSAATPTGKTIDVFASDLSASAQKVGAILQWATLSRYTDQWATETGYSATNNTISYAGNASAPAAGTWRVVGDAQDISSAGQFGWNSTTQQISFKPTSQCGFSASSSGVVASLGSLITFSTVSGLTISGLTFQDTISPRTGYTDYAGTYNTLPLGTLQGTGLTNSTITNNKFVNVGNGISLVSSTGNTITWNTFDQLGGMAMSFKTQSNSNTFSYNTMTSLGQLNFGASGVYVENSASVTVNANYINTVGRMGINVAVSDATSTSSLAITNNTVINTNRQTNDTAAIYAYAGSNASQVNISSVITGNRVENLGAIVTNNAGTWGFAQNRGIYMDEHTSGVTINNNVIEDNWQGILLCSGCTGNSASNNVIALNAQPLYSNYQGTQSSATGAMTLNGTTSIALEPSYFPSNVATSTIVVQLTGTSTNAIPPQFNVLADGAVIGSATAPTNGTTVQQNVFQANLTPRTIHTIGVQLINGANTGSATQSLGNMLLFVNNTLVSLAASSSYGMQVLSAGTQPDVSNFSFTKNIVYRSSGAGSDASLYFNPGTYTDANPGTIDYNLLYANLTAITGTAAGSGTYGYTLDKHSKIANPLFLNTTIGDYTLQSGSPAFGLGFTSTGVPLAPPASYPATAVTGCTVF
jgi:parallel beta-helix repeat protein